jgi:hypothetical protein
MVVTFQLLFIHIESRGNCSCDLTRGRFGKVNVCKMQHEKDGCAQRFQALLDANGS